jgi:hypothetical protein
VDFAEAEAGFLKQLPARGRREVLIGPDEAAGERPHAQSRGLAAGHEQHGEGSLADRQDGEVDGDRKRRVVARVVIVHASIPYRINRQIDEKRPGELSSL